MLQENRCEGGGGGGGGKNKVSSLSQQIRWSRKIIYQTAAPHQYFIIVPMEHFLASRPYISVFFFTFFIFPDFFSNIITLTLSFAQFSLDNIFCRLCFDENKFFYLFSFFVFCNFLESLLKFFSILYFFLYSNFQHMFLINYE